MSNRNLFILRGVPGAGKSTLAKILAGNGGTICSADDYFMENGAYVFRPTELPRAHAQCQMMCERAMKDGNSTIIVDNVNAAEEHMDPYRRLADRFGYRVFYLVVEHRHDGMTSKDVPPWTMQKNADLLRKSIRLG